MKPFIESLEDILSPLDSNPAIKADAIERTVNLIEQTVDAATPPDSPHHDVIKTEGYYAGIIDLKRNLRSILREEKQP